MINYKNPTFTTNPIPELISTKMIGVKALHIIFSYVIDSRYVALAMKTIIDRQITVSRVYRFVTMVTM
jgi:hypothetical protein